MSMKQFILDNDNMDFALEVLKLIGAWGLVVLGWMVVSDQQEKRELAKNGYARINLLRDALRAICAKGIAHHTEVFDDNRVREILRSLKVFSIEMSHLRKHGYIAFSTSNDAFAFRQAITVKNFDSGSYVAQSHESEIVANIEVVTDSLDRQLLESAHKVSCSQHTLRESLSRAVKRF